MGPSRTGSITGITFEFPPPLSTFHFVIYDRGALALIATRRRSRQTANATPMRRPGSRVAARATARVTRQAALRKQKANATSALDEENAPQARSHARRRRDFPEPLPEATIC